LVPADPLTLAFEKELARITVGGATSLLDRAYKWYSSYDLLILGQERAGKTALYKFLRSRLLSKDGEQTAPTVDDIDSGIIRFEWTTDTGALTLELRNIGDRSGQIGPHAHAQMFVNKKPHLLVIVLDVTASLEEAGRLHASYATWFEYFCTYVGDLLMNHPRRAHKVRSKLHNMVILLNKTDTLDPATADNVIAEATSRIRGILRTRLQHYFGGRVDNFPVLPCSIVSNPRNQTSGYTIDKLREAIRQLVTSTITR
jgi:hypothetical protein